MITDPYASLYREFSMEIQEIIHNSEHMELYEELPDICYQINRLLGIANDRKNQEKILVIWLGLDVIADFLTEQPEQKSRELENLSLGTISRLKRVSAAKEKNDGGIAFQSALEKDFKALFSDIGMEDVSLETEEDEFLYAEENMDDLLEEQNLYNACDDIEKLLHIGPTRNIYNLVIYDTSAALKDFRGARTSDFGHKIAFAMSDNEAADFLDRVNLLRTLPHSMAFYYDGRSGKKFIPYKF